LGSLLLVLGDEGPQFSLIVNHEHFLHIAKPETVVGAFSRASNLVSNSVGKLANEEVVGHLGNVLLLLEDFLVAALHEVRFEADWHLDVDVAIDVFLRDQLNFSVILGNPTQPKHKSENIISSIWCE